MQTTTHAPPDTGCIATEGLASDSAVAALGGNVVAVRLVLTTEDSASGCACRPGTSPHRPLTIVGVGPSDPVLQTLDAPLHSGQVLTDPTHGFWVGHPMSAPGMKARVVGTLPFTAPTLVTTLSDFTQIALASAPSAARTMTHALLAGSSDDPSLRGPADHTPNLSAWHPTSDPLELEGARS